MIGWLRRRAEARRARSAGYWQGPSAAEEPWYPDLPGEPGGWSITAGPGDVRVYGTCDRCGRARSTWTAHRFGQSVSGVFCPGGHGDQLPFIGEL